MATSRCASLLLLVVAFLLSAAAGDASEVKSVCGKTAHPEYCVKVLTECNETNASDEHELAQVLMNFAANLSSEVERLARGEEGKLPKESAEGHCMQRCADSFKGAAQRLGKVDRRAKTAMNKAFYEGALLYLSIRKRDMDQSWNYNCNECQGHNATGDLAAKHSDFDMVIDMVNTISHEKKTHLIGKFRESLG